MSFAEPPPECRLSDKSKAAVTLYTTFAITLLSMATSSLDHAAVMAMIAWFPMFRAVVGVVIYTVKIVPGCLEDVLFDRLSIEIEDIPATSSRWTRFKYLLLQKSHIRYYADAESTAGFFTYPVWAFWHFWIPFSQIDWLARHFHSASGGLMFARASGVGVSLVGMSIDYKARVITALGSRFGMPVAVLLSIYTIMARLALVGVMSAEYIVAIQRAGIPLTKFQIVSTIFFSALLCLMTYVWIPGRDCDADDDDDKHTMCPSGANIMQGGFWGMCFMSLCWAVVAGICVFCICIIAYVVYFAADNSNGLGISAYAKCERIDVWSKIQSLIC